MTGEICGDNRFEIIEKFKQNLIEHTNIETSADEMSCLDSFLFRCWQMGWLKIIEDYEKLKYDFDLYKIAVDDVVNTAKMELAIFRDKMKPTAASGYKVENGKIYFSTDILNGYREDYDTVEQVAGQLNLLLHECYRLMELESRLRFKQTPMKVAHTDTGTEICPACGRYLDCFGKAGKFCRDCGQALDWSDAEETPKDMTLKEIEDKLSRNTSIQN